jgi:HlyD family secretion protein
VGEPVPVKRADLVLTVEVEGELAAVRSTEIGVPPVAEVDFKIAFLAPEGTAVKKGEPILKLDAEPLERRLAEKRAEFAEAQKKVEQKEIDLRMKLLELDQQTAQSRADLGKAQLKAEVPPEVQRIELEKALLDRRGRERDLENLVAERRVTEALAGAELLSLRQQRDRARGRVEALEAAIEKMTVRAPQDGIVVYRTNWRDEKKKVGDSVWFGEVVLALPDLSEMEGDGFVDEADGGPVAEGQPVTLRLEARSDFDLKGKVARIARTVRQRSWRVPLKGYRVEIALEKTDPTFMRPAMRFRGEIETGRVAGLLLLPRQAVFLRDDGPVVWARRGLGWREVKVKLGRTNRKQVEIVSGLVEGDLVSPVDLSTPGRERPGGPAGTAG